MQPGFEFFTKRLVHKPLARDARQAFEGRRHQRDAIMRLALRPCAGVAFVQRRLIFHRKPVRRKVRAEPSPHALGARKMLFLVCQFLVRLTLGAHTR